MTAVMIFRSVVFSQQYLCHNLRRRAALTRGTAQANLGKLVAYQRQTQHGWRDPGLLHPCCTSNNFVSNFRHEGVIIITALPVLPHTRARQRSCVDCSHCRRAIFARGHDADNGQWVKHSPTSAPTNNELFCCSAILSTDLYCKIWVAVRSFALFLIFNFPTSSDFLFCWPI